MTPISNYDWVETNSPVASSRTDDIWFFDPQAGWLVNSNGIVASTEDGGDTWKEKQLVDPQGPMRPYLRCVSFASRQKGWVGVVLGATSDGYEDHLLHVTDDGGNNWQPVTNLPKGSPKGICGLSVVNESVVYGSGTNDPKQQPVGIVKTVDGGQSWELIDMRPWATNLIDIHFFDADRGFVVGGKARDDCKNPPPSYASDPQYWTVKPVVLYTEDGGKTWTNKVACMDFSCGEWGWKIDFVNEQVGFVSLENFIEANILRTLDGGQTWEKFKVNDRRPTRFGVEVTNANLEGIGFIDKEFGWVGGWGNDKFIGTYNSVTQDGGRTWRAEDYAVNSRGQPVGDVRLNVNRFRFFGTPVSAGYCSGKKVYKLVVNDQAAVRAAGLAAMARAAVKTTFDISAEPTEKGLRIHYTVPEKAGRVQLGLWNQFAFHFRTLVDEKDVEPGAKTVEWDGTDDDGRQRRPGAVICRLTIDGRTESDTFSLQ